MTKEFRTLGIVLKKQLQEFSQTDTPLPGVDEDAALDTFVFQIVESVRRIRFICQIAERPISAMRADPNSELFDPIRAAILKRNAGDLDEAFWFVFLFTHFGKNLRSGYRLVRDIYARAGQAGLWDWVSVSNDPMAFRHWLDNTVVSFQADSVHRAFGNHRKYQSLDAWKPNGTGDAVQTYVQWVMNNGGHKQLFDTALNEGGGDPEVAFGLLYRGMSAVHSFGRTAKFDYLSMVGKAGLAHIKPDSVHFGSATGPLIGAKLLFLGDGAAKAPASQMQALADKLATSIDLDKQAMEDSLCNWQKSPTEVIRFRG